MPIAMMLAAATGATLGPIRIQLYYKTSGTLSRDFATGPKPSFWNTGAGEGDTKEPAEDMIVSVPVRMPPGRDMGENSDVPLTITVRNRAGKVIASRRFAWLSIPYKDPVWSALWVSGIQCAGPLAIEAAWGGQKRAAKVSFDCGE